MHWTREDARTGQSQAEWLDLVRACEEDERRGAQALRDLAHRAHLALEPLASELLEAMALDSEKHARLLKFVSHRLSLSEDQGPGNTSASSRRSSA